MSAPTRALAIVSIGVLLASSTWFTGTAAAGELVGLWRLNESQAALLTNATQLGFIVGTLMFAIANLADRFDARRVFGLSAAAGALANLGFGWLSNDLASALVFRLLTGVALAGVYPVGMKIVASWFSTGLGWRLGVLVGCLTLGTSFPHAITALQPSVESWAGAGPMANVHTLASAASIAALCGGALVQFGLRAGPLLQTRAPLDLRMAFAVFRHPPFRATAFGYFGHMWELYALWSLSSFYLTASLESHAGWLAAVPSLAFGIVAIGALGCGLGGLLSRRIGERNVAAIALVGSGAACLGSGFASALPPTLLAIYVLIWGLLVVADSPQFSALAALHAPANYTATALTMLTGIGFLVTMVAIQTLPWLASIVGWRWSFTVLAIGPLLGVLSLRRLPA